MPFEVYKRQRAPVSQEPTVTVQKRGSFSMNAAAHAALGSPEALELLFDRESNILGLRGVDASVAHSYPLRAVGKTTWVFSGKAFAQYYGIEVGSSRRYPASLEGDILVADLNQPGAEVTSNRAQNRQPNKGLPEPLL
jgi:hypothetical protein